MDFKMSKSTCVGLIGLGAMGRGVASNLLAKGFDVVGYDIREEARDWLQQQGGTGADSLKALAAKTRIVISFVVNSDQTESILYGEDGLVSFLPAGAVVIVCSTMDPAYVEDLAKRLKADSIHLVDAPVTGGAAGAAKGSLTIMGSGEIEAFNEAKPILQTFGARVYHLGPASAGARMKVLNQLLCGVHLAVAGEAIALARRQGLPLDTTLEILSSGSAGSWMLADRGPRMVSEKFDDVTSAVDIGITYGGNRRVATCFCGNSLSARHADHLD